MRRSFLARKPVGERLYRLVAALGLALALGVLTLVASRKPLWYDELFSYYIARLPSLRAVLDALLGGADNGPPIDYWIRHLSLQAFGGGNLAFRLPSLLAMAASALCLWQFVRRRSAALAALVAAALPFGTLAAHYAVEGRAYAVLFVLAAASLWAWQGAHESRRPLGFRLLLGVLLAASPLVHYFGVLNVLPIFAGEAALWWQHRRPSRTLWFVLASQLSLLLLPPFARHAVTMREAFWAGSYGPLSSIATYPTLLGSLLWPLLGLFALGGLLSLSRLRSARSAPAAAGMPRHEQIAALSLALVPFAVLAMAMTVTHAMTYRYSLVAILGLALLAAQALHVVARRSNVAATSIAVVLLTLTALSLYSTWQRETTRVPWSGLERYLAQTQLRVVCDSPRRYLESYHRVPPQSRPYLLYLTDRELARRHLGYDNDEIALVNLQRIEALSVEPYEQFHAENSEFLLLVDDQPGWLSAQLEEEGARLTRLRSLDDLVLYRVIRAPSH